MMNIYGLKTGQNNAKTSHVVQTALLLHRFYILTDLKINYYSSLLF